MIQDLFCRQWPGNEDISLTGHVAETMHSATREGVDVAVGRVEAQGQGIIGTAIPVAEHAVAR